jgi:hypothetical protein
MGDRRVRLSHEGDEVAAGSPSEYIWANCRSQGWQVLVPASNLRCSRPEPPQCVLHTPKNLEKARAPKTMPVVSAPQVQLEPAVPEGAPTAAELVENNTVTSGQVWQATLKASPAKNFVASNRLNISPPNRVTKSTLLEQASRQLRESEKIGDSLAARLKIIKKQLDT